jgi:hypothetical protein
MDLRHYYQKIRDMETKIEQPYPVVVSLETADGGKAGALTEVPRRIAAKMVVDGFARLATPPEAAAFQAVLDTARREAEQAAAASKVQLTLLSTDDLHRLKSRASELEN